MAVCFHDPPCLQPDQQEDGVLEQERDPGPVDAFAQAGRGGLKQRRTVGQNKPGEDNSHDA